MRYCASACARHALVRYALMRYALMRYALVRALAWLAHNHLPHTRTHSLIPPQKPGNRHTYQLNRHEHDPEWIRVMLQ